MGKNWAIVVGINNYDNLQPLKYAKRDAEKMQAWFKNEAKFDQVFLFTEDSPSISTNPPISTQPTQGRFKRFLNVQFEEPLLKPEDNLWFFFAGHGKRFADQDYLMFIDTDPTDSETAISVDYVRRRLQRCGADNVVLLIDACRDEGDRSGLGVGMQEHKGVITFYSCAANEKSWEIDELQHGSFTYILLEGLRLQGEVNCATVERLQQHLRYKVPQLNNHYKKSPQNPALKAEPPYKMYYILLEQAATIKDAEPLKYQASLAENKGDLLLAKQLWVRVLAVSRGDNEAIEAIERIALKGKHPVVNPITESLSLTQPIDGATGDRGATFEPNLQQKHDYPVFQFDVVTVNAKGEEIKREKREEKYFTEKLPNNVTLDIMSIPGGKFLMGSHPDEARSSSNERPKHDVIIPFFFMGKYPITQAQWRAVASLEPVNLEIAPDPSNFKGDNRPVEKVSWYDAVEFCNRLSKYTGRPYCLPSEAQWEYACRAGTTTPFHCGDNLTPRLANCQPNILTALFIGFTGETAVVGSYFPNAFGLYDMHGNVWEWCLDDWHNNYEGAPTDGNPWFNNNDNLYQKKGRAVLRGGSWFNNPHSCRSAYRILGTRDNHYVNNGFRVVCAAGRTFQ